MRKSNSITMERYFVCLFRSSTQSSPSHTISRLEFFPGNSKYHFDQQNDWLKIYCKTQSNMKSSKGHFSGSSTTSVLVTIIDAPMLTNNLPPCFIPWSWCSCQPYHRCITVYLDSLLKETDCFSPRKRQGFSSSVDGLPWGCHSRDRTRPIVASPNLHHPKEPLVLRHPLCAPHPTACSIMLWKHQSCRQQSNLHITSNTLNWSHKNTITILEPWGHRAQVKC